MTAVEHEELKDYVKIIALPFAIIFIGMIMAYTYEYIDTEVVYYQKGVSSDTFLIGDNE